MNKVWHKIWIEDDGVLSFEWVLLVTLLTIGIVSGLAAARDAVIDELGDAAQAMLALDQSYALDFPLDVQVHGGSGSCSSDSTFTDVAVFSDCERTQLIGQGGEDDGAS